eukprot:8426696-Pyramimonas_sp.AAC.1
MCEGRMRAVALELSVELPMGAKRVKGVPKWVWGTHVGGPTGAFGGAPYGATNRSAGWAKMPNWVWDARGRSHWGLRWSSLWGHDA